MLLDPDGRLDWSAWLADRRACARLGGAVGLAALCASGALAQSSAPNAATAPIPGSAPIAGNSGELIETPIGSGEAAAPAATPANAGPGQPAAQPAGAPAPPSQAGGVNPFGFLGAASRSANLLGDMWGLRPALAKYGLT